MLSFNLTYEGQQVTSKVFSRDQASITFHRLVSRSIHLVNYSDSTRPS